MLLVFILCNAKISVLYRSQTHCISAHESNTVFLYVQCLQVFAKFCMNIYLSRYGRWIVIAISTVIYSIVAVATAWMPNMSTLLIARFLLGTMHPVSLQSCYILGMLIHPLFMIYNLFLMIVWILSYPQHVLEGIA